MKRDRTSPVKVAAIVVTYNRKDLLLENIDCLMRQTERTVMDIIIVNNASTDGTEDALVRFIDNNALICLNTDSNLGGAGGFQFGMRYAAEHDYTHAWVMDDDCMPKDNALEELLKWDENLDGEYGFLSSKVLWKDGSLCKMNVQREKVTRNLQRFDQKCVSVEMASFVSLFIPIAVIEALGLPIKEFFIWTDDWEYTRRISREYASYVIPSSVVVHKSHSNEGANIAIDAAERLDRYEYLYRNDVYLYRREGFRGFVYEAARLALHVARVLIKAPDNRWKRIRSIFAGTRAGFSFDPQIEYPHERD